MTPWHSRRGHHEKFSTELSLYHIVGLFVPMTSDLKRLVERLNAPQVVSCSACRGSFDDCVDLFTHIEEDHGIALPSSNNLVDVDSFLALVHRLCNRELSASSEAVMSCFAKGTLPAGTTGAPADAQSSVDDQVDDNDDDWEDDEDCQIPSQCLFCPVISNTVEEHMGQAHAFKLRASALFDRCVCSDEYARVRLVNFTRSKVLKGQCPAEPCEFKSNDADILAQHIREHSHFFTTSVPEGDEWVTATLRGDAFMMLVMGADDEEALEPEYPMVPTMMELARRHREQRGDDDE